MKKIRIIAMISALIVFMLSYLYIKSISSKEIEASNKYGREIVAVTAKSDIKPGTIITEDMLERNRVVIAEDYNDFYENISDIVGRVSISDIYMGEMITSKRVVEKDSLLLGLSSKVAPGMRAITIMVDTEKGIGYNLNVGDKVDVMYIVDTKSLVNDERDLAAGERLSEIYGIGLPENTCVFNENLSTNYVGMILQNVKVIAIDTDIYYDTSRAKDGFSNVTLELKPDDAMKLELVRDISTSMYLTLRNISDNDELHDKRINVVK